MSITAVVLCHPQSARLVTPKTFQADGVRALTVSCGTTKMQDVDFSESNDFYPTYASWNAALFETSVILTVWEHADELIADNHVAIMHSDVRPHFDVAETWQRLRDELVQSPTVGLVAPSQHMGLWEREWHIPAAARYIPKYDPMWLHAFDNGVFVWDFIKKYDPDMFAWAMDVQPSMIYSHQFICPRATFDALGHYLFSVARRMQLDDIGLWTPHVFERLIALFLARLSGDPRLTTAFWHYSSSGVFGPGAHSLYGPRPRKFYRIKQRWLLNEGN